jgi:hypothetical protein
LIADPEPGTQPNPLYRLPNGTLSHTVWIRTLAGIILYRTHVYVCLHGNFLGPNGLLDPKDLYEYAPSQILKAEARIHKDNGRCPSCGTWEPRSQRARRALVAYSRRCQICP